MVERQIAARGISDPALLAALRKVPREQFVAERLAGVAYADRALPIEAGQTISQPYIVALMIDAAEIGPRRPCARGRCGVGLCRGGARPRWPAT